LETSSAEIIFGAKRTHRFMKTVTLLVAQILESMYFIGRKRVTTRHRRFHVTHIPIDSQNSEGTSVVQPPARPGIQAVTVSHITIYHIVLLRLHLKGAKHGWA
jgi:hypothetical protein